MTSNPTDPRFIAAVAFLQGSVIRLDELGWEKLSTKDSCESTRGIIKDKLKIAVFMTDALLAELERTKPKCEHKNIYPPSSIGVQIPGIGYRCSDCGEVLK